MAKIKISKNEIIQWNEYSNKINNRKILEGYYSGLDMENTSAAIRLIDKVDKIGFDGVADLLKVELGLNTKTIDKIFQLTQIRGSGQQVVDQIQNLGVHSELLDQGLTELTFVMQELEHIDINDWIKNHEVHKDRLTPAIIITAVVICSGLLTLSFAGFLI